MSKKQDRSSVGDVPSCSPKFVCPVSFVCLLICTAALVRVEIINKRVHHVEDVIAEVRQIHDLINCYTAKPSKNIKGPSLIE